jgi:O-6-methylguanine DNA methyltransferase
MTIEQRLHALAMDPPAGLEESTLVTAGAADRVARVDSPVGDVWIAWSTRGCTGLIPAFAAGSFDDFSTRHRRAAYPAAKLPLDLDDVVHEALESGVTQAVPIDLAGIGEFQRSVLATCSTIGPGSVRSYGWIAETIDKPGAVRAVGTALGRNPIPLLVPCHRVVRSDGSVGNYAFGAEMKRRLLVREGAILA